MLGRVLDRKPTPNTRSDLSSENEDLGQKYKTRSIHFLTMTNRLSGNSSEVATVPDAHDNSY